MIHTYYLWAAAVVVVTLCMNIYLIVIIIIALMQYYVHCASKLCVNQLINALAKVNIELVSLEFKATML